MVRKTQNKIQWLILEESGLRFLSYLRHGICCEGFAVDLCQRGYKNTVSRTHQMLMGSTRARAATTVAEAATKFDVAVVRAPVHDSRGLFPTARVHTHISVRIPHKLPLE